MPIARVAKRLVKDSLRALTRRWNERVQPLPLHHWDLVADARGRLSLEGVELAELIQRFGSPLHVVHAQALRRNIAAFCDPAPGHPPCAVYYSYKTNPIPGVLQLMHARGVGAEVISAYELWLALRLGVAPGDIIYNGPVKSDDSLRQAIAREIYLINANHREELTRISTIAHEVGKRPRVGLRVTTSGGWAGQFGCSIPSGEALEALREACSDSALDVVALHAHLGAPIRSAETARGFVHEVMEFAEQARQSFGFVPELIDFGGSLGVPTVAGLGEREKRFNMTFLGELTPPSPEAALGIRDYVRVVCDEVASCARRHGQNAPKIVLEPGRAMTGNTQLLLTSVHSVKATREPPLTAILDAGINLAQSVQSEYHQVFSATKANRERNVAYRLAGPICSPGDVLYWSYRLPQLEPGDPLVIVDAGAYFVPFATSFSFPQPAIVMVDGGRATLLRRAERFEDLVALDDAQLNAPGWDRADRVN
jgi:diaminopimelate decarboxylase